MTEWTLSFVLREIASAMDKLIDLAGQKSEAIVDGDIPRLNEVTAEEEELSRSLAALEEERLRLVGSSDQGDPEIDRLRQSLREKADRIEVLNERNQELLRQGLRLVEFELKLLLPQPSYSGTPAKGPVVFDHKV
ncbi:MAG: flagellar protein FlgN [Bacillota bacterium]|jgi:flagellar biosynthesis/type III secretory pathway chaperone|nr:flagellar protein FlgN [Candidatus Fermentithermobacillaceae bacterium]